MSKRLGKNQIKIGIEVEYKTRTVIQKAIKKYFVNVMQCRFELPQDTKERAQPYKPAKKKKNVA
jgi:hypothetical protein